jgi:hypothetical protein
MKRSTFRIRKSPDVPIAWREANYAALRARAADKDDDRIMDDIFDAEDERAEVDSIVHGMIRDAS